jgi:hypothetical protein
MLRSTCLVIAVLALASAAAAQQADEPQTLDELIDFVLRPGEDAVGEEEDIWNWDTEPEQSLLESEIGPELAGPTGDEVIGPPLLGPDVPLDEGERAAPTKEEGDPFAATGVRLGAFVIRPSIETGFTATDNVTGEEHGRGAIGLVVAPALNIRSQDERYQLEANLNAEGVFYNESQFDTHSGEARLAGRYALTEQTSIFGVAGYSRYDESFSENDTPSGAAKRPVVNEFDATLGVERSFGRFTTRASGFADRTVYQDVPLVGGGTASRKGEDNTDYGGRWRTGYLLGAGITPFTEVAAGRRAFDQSVDADGFRRSSLWGELRGGLVINRGHKLSGEVSVGFRHEELEDDALPDINALLLNAAILWSPRRLTEVHVDLYTDVQPTSVADESGTVLYSGLVTVSRSLTSRFKVSVGGGVDYEYSVGGDWRDVTFVGHAEASYAFNRVASVIATYDYEQTESTQVGGDSRAHTVGVRVRIQR